MRSKRLLGIVISFALLALLSCNTSSTGGYDDDDDQNSSGCDQGVWDDCYASNISGANCSGDCVDLADCWGDAWDDLASCLENSGSCDCEGSECSVLRQKADDCYDLADCYQSEGCGSTSCSGGTCSAVN